MLKWEQLNEAQQQQVNEQMDIIRRGVVEIVPEAQLKQKVMDAVVLGKKLKIKLGLDPSAPDLHIGHTVVMHKLRQFQQLGHVVQLVIGDFTGRIGDPTGKSETRKQLSEEEVNKNAQTYKDQLFKILDPKQTEVYYNSQWLAPMSFVDVIHLCSKMTVARMLERDDFTKRYQAHQPISMHEFFYPLMQGTDSVVLQSDIELGGTDQKFNLLMGRMLQKENGISQQVAMMLPLLEGLDGVQKMSKSLDNYIGIHEHPNEIYGKSMSIPDKQMMKYYTLATDISNEQLEQLQKGLDKGEVHPRDAKMKLAHTFVQMYHGVQAADVAQHHFVTVFQQRQLPDDIIEFFIAPEKLENGGIKLHVLLMLLKFSSSNTEARRSIQQGAVKINQQKITDYTATYVPMEGDIVQVGKRKFAKIIT